MEQAPTGLFGGLALPWLGEPLRRARAYGGHALLVHGPEGIGQLELALTLALDRLCEAPVALASSSGASTMRHCGECAACRLVQAQAHPDLRVLMPEATAQQLGWNPGGEGEPDGKEKAASKAKPSKDIKVDAVRAAVVFSQTTSSRGRGKVVLIFPAERMNAVSANALLKTLEEPPGEGLYLLVSSEPQLLLPTIRSRCQAIALSLPEPGMAHPWLKQEGVDSAEVLLAAAGGQPQRALAWFQEGLTAARWQQLPAQLRRGEVGDLTHWPVGRLLDMLSKLCHDALCTAAGAPPRYFPGNAMSAAMKSGLDTPSLLAWQRHLQVASRHAEHPWNAALAVEAHVQRAALALGAEP
jgi:DNA polymerase-3 subunit delta'